MSDLFHLVRGITQGTADYVDQQRKIQRDREDKELDFVKGTLTSMASRPDFDSSEYASMLNYMHTLSQPRPQKKGMAGLMGQHEALPISQLIGAATHGDPTQPFKGDPTQTPIDDQKLARISKLPGMPQAAGGPQKPDASQSAPATGMPPEPQPATPPPSPVAASGVPNPPMPAPPQALQPQPPASEPQPPGTKNLVGAANDVALDQQVQANNPALPKPPAMPPGMGDQDLATAKASRTPNAMTGGQGWFKSPDEQRIQTGRADFSNAVSASAGKMAGARVELQQMLGREPTLPELRQYMTGKIGTQRVIWQAHPSDPTKEVAMLENSMTGELSPASSPDGQQMTRLKSQGVARAQEEADVSTATGASSTAAKGVVARRNVAGANAKLNNLNLSAQVKQQVLSAKSLDEAVKIMNAAGIDLQQSLDVAKSVMGGGGGGNVPARPGGPAGLTPPPGGGAPDLSNVRKVTGQTLSMQEGAKMLLPHIGEVQQQAQTLDEVGLFGPMMSRVTALAAKYGTVKMLNSSDLDEQQRAMNQLGEAISSDPELANDRRVGRFTSSLGLLMTGAARVHGGSRGGGSPQMLQHFKAMLGANATLPMFLGKLDGLNDFISGYAKGPGGQGAAAVPTAPEKGFIYAKDPSTGVVHKAKAGTPLRPGFVSVPGPQ
jgi:hypothetical protein